MTNYIDIIRNAKIVLVHGAEFHADDVFFVALATIVNPSLKIERSLNLEYIRTNLDNPDYIIGDIGDGRWDHHLPDSPSRESGKRYASFGLLWKDIGADLCNSEEVANRIDQKFISIIDANDNGDFKPFSQVTSLIKDFRSSWDSYKYEEEMNENFIKAVAFARTILENTIRQEMALQRGIEYLEDNYASRGEETISEGIVVMTAEVPQYKNWALSKPDVRWIIFKTLRGYSIIQIGEHFPGGRNPIPEEYWIGNDPTGEKGILPKGIKFCHKTGYMMAAEFLAAAIDAVMDLNREFIPFTEDDLLNALPHDLSDIVRKHCKDNTRVMHDEIEKISKSYTAEDIDSWYDICDKFLTDIENIDRESQQGFILARNRIVYGGETKESTFYEHALRRYQRSHSLWAKIRKTNDIVKRIYDEKHNIIPFSFGSLFRVDPYEEEDYSDPYDLRRLFKEMYNFEPGAEMINNTKETFKATTYDEEIRLEEIKNERLEREAAGLPPIAEPEIDPNRDSLLTDEAIREAHEAVDALRKRRRRNYEGVESTSNSSTKI